MSGTVLRIVLRVDGRARADDGVFRRTEVHDDPRTRHPLALAALAVSATPAFAGLLSSPLGVSASANGYVASHTEGQLVCRLEACLARHADVEDCEVDVVSERPLDSFSHSR